MRSRRQAHAVVVAFDPLVPLKRLKAPELDATFTAASEAYFNDPDNENMGAVVDTLLDEYRRRAIARGDGDPERPPTQKELLRAARDRAARRAHSEASNWFAWWPW